MVKKQEPLITCPCGCGFLFQWSDKEAVFMFVNEQGVRSSIRSIRPGHAFYKDMAEQLRQATGKTVLSQ